MIKLWETLAEQGVGNLLRPWQVRREGKAQVDVRRYELLALAEAEREAEEVRSGRRKLSDGKYAISLTAALPKDESPTADTRPEKPPLQIAAASAVADSLRKEVNVAKAVIHAEDDLKNDESAPSTKKIEPDWLYRWRDYAGDVSTNELQAIWGRILAGELKDPGSYSYRLLEFVRNLSKEEAQTIEKISTLTFVDFIAREPKEALEAERISFSFLLELQELGVVTGVDSLGLQRTINSTVKDKFTCALLCHRKGLLIEHADPAKKLAIAAYVVTNLGQQVMALGKFVPNETYIRAVGQHIKKSGFDVSLIDYVPIGNGMVKYFNKQEIK